MKKNLTLNPLFYCIRFSFAGKGNYKKHIATVNDESKNSF